MAACKHIRIQTIKPSNSEWFEQCVTCLAVRCLDPLSGRLGDWAQNMGGEIVPMMADTLPKNQTLTLALSRTIDLEITCIACNQNGCQWESTVRLPGRRITFGVHEKCRELMVGATDE